MLVDEHQSVELEVQSSLCDAGMTEVAKAPAYLWSRRRKAEERGEAEES